MAPTSRRGKATRKATKRLRTRHKRKVAPVLEDLPSNSSTISSDNLSKIKGFDIEGVDDTSTSTTSPCSTPKAGGFGYRRSIHALRHRRNKGLSPIAHCKEHLLLSLLLRI
ncbi:putative heteroproteinous nuclear ribonucleoprotein [Hibiscus syriacus]|uniref:Heteroproteinous nuclear ribonucleoprotein n=1 Tax=Hibiscus syriacus TaxID=106335 RepID=A0A6A2ZII8_HIBSY|nr:putative heteroproteinous nuclear ribonucleoprotein [Hibiscus syriacus]